MTTFTKSQGARSASAVLDLSSLVTGNYKVSSVIDLGSAIPLDTTFEVSGDPSGAPTGNGQVILFAKLSLDNVNWGSGPESGTSTTNEGDLHWLGTLDVKDDSVHRKFFNLENTPTARYLKLVVKNDIGVTITTGAVYMSSITGVST